jgi:hypothetical protein
MAQLLGQLPGFERDEIPSVINALKTVIVTTLERTIMFPHGARITAPDQYDRFAKPVTYLRTEAHPEQSVSIITFNYDIACDLALFQNECEPIYGLPGNAEMRSARVPLLKLYGSLNWARRTDNETVEPLHMRRFMQWFGQPPPDRAQQIRLPIGDALRACFAHAEFEIEPEPFIVPPTWKKVQHHEILHTVWGRAARELSDAQHIFLMGYSLPETDSFFRLLYALGTVGDAPLTSIVVYNPDDREAVRKRFEDLLGPGAKARFQYKLCDFGAAISDVANSFARRP